MKVLEFKGESLVGTLQNRSRGLPGGTSHARSAKPERFGEPALELQLYPLCIEMQNNKPTYLVKVFSTVIFCHIGAFDTDFPALAARLTVAPFPLSTLKGSVCANGFVSAVASCCI